MKKVDEANILRRWYVDYFEIYDDNIVLEIRGLQIEKLKNERTHQGYHIML